MIVENIDLFSQEGYFFKNIVKKMAKLQFDETM